MAALRLDGVTKSFGAHPALRGINLEISAGEFFSILGPSGCGKTTLLRVIAGLEHPSSGRVLMDGRDITPLPPQDRGIGMVFQNYALFPHMSVYDNVAFGLRSRRIPDESVRARVGEILAAVGMLARRETPVPHLSGGEQQRVAVARALVVEPDLLLFDEPLSNLDAGLRLKTREEIRRLQRSTGITTVYVTHDQAEAMSLSDRVAVMQAGAVEQVGAPQDIYTAPHSLFVAGFLGGGTVLEGVIDRESGTFRAGSFALPLSPGYAGAFGDVTVSVRPEAVGLDPVGAAHGPGDGGSCGRIEDREFLGFTTTAVVLLGGLRLHAAAVSSESTRAWVPGTAVCVRLDWSRCAVFRRP